MSQRLPATPPLQALLPVRPPLRVLILYATGQLGWSLASFAVGNLLVYFYMPPEQGAPIFPSLIYQGAVMGVLTLIGLLSAGGRVLDGLIDPLVANWSDRKKAAIGKRRWFMLWGSVPFALFATLVFMPPDSSESAANLLWVGVCTALYYFFFAFYVIPFNALLAELGHTPADRMRISTLISVAWALGFVLGNGIYALQSVFENMGYSSLRAFQTAVTMLNAFALLCMLAPALFLNEKRYARQSPGEQSLRESIGAVFQNRNFRWFLASFLLYWLALTFIQLGVAFYATLLMGLDKSAAFTFSILSFFCSFLLYWPLNEWVKKRGKRRTMLNAFLLFGVLFAVVTISGVIPLPKMWLLYALAITAAAPLAVFGILPNAIVGDEAARAEQHSGKPLSGMFFGVTAFTMKVGISLANLIFPSLLLLGKSSENPAGVQLSALAALVFCLCGWAAFRRYRESD
jgi:Na+/melibiose symporter-like transporter